MEGQGVCSPQRLMQKRSADRDVPAADMEEQLSQLEASIRRLQETNERVEEIKRQLQADDQWLHASNRQLRAAFQPLDSDFKALRTQERAMTTMAKHYRKVGLAVERAFLSLQEDVVCTRAQVFLCAVFSLVLYISWLSQLSVLHVVTLGGSCAINAG